MKVRELLDIKEDSRASEIEARVNDLGSKTNTYRQFKSLAALKALQKSQRQIIDALKNKPA